MAALTLHGHWIPEKSSVNGEAAPSSCFASDDEIQKQQKFSKWTRQDFKDLEACVAITDSVKYRRSMIPYECKSNGEIITHNYASLINMKTGDVYIDCSKRKIFAKTLFMTLWYPINTIFKTLYFVTLIPCVIEIVKNFRKPASERKWSHCAYALADIIRTPLYGLAMTVVAIAAVFIAPFHSTSLYRMREIQGNLAAALNYHYLDDYQSRKHDLFFTPSPCFLPGLNIGNYSSWEQAGVALHDFASKQIEFRQEHRALFNDCGRLLSADRPYQSVAWPEKRS